MGKYLAYQIILKKLMYNTVTKKIPKSTKRLSTVLLKLWDGRLIQKVIV